MSRSAKEFDRIYGSKDRCDFVAQLPCIICGAVPSQNAHIQNGGMGRKASAEHIVPLCALHHAEFDNKINGGRHAFFTAHGVSMDWMRQMAALTERLWVQYNDPSSKAHHASEP